MKTLAELTAERDRIQAMIDKGEYQPETLEQKFHSELSKWFMPNLDYAECSKWLAHHARRHLLPIVPAGEAKEGEHGLAWDGSVWYAAKRMNAVFYPASYLGATLPLFDITHWLPAARVPGPTQEPRP